MSLTVILRPAAEADVDRIRADLDTVMLGLGDDFASRLREVLRRIEHMPQLYGVVWQDVRAARLRRFKTRGLLRRVSRPGGSDRRPARLARSIRLAIARLIIPFAAAEEKLAKALTRSATAGP